MNNDNSTHEANESLESALRDHFQSEEDREAPDWLRDLSEDEIIERSGAEDKASGRAIPMRRTAWALRAASIAAAVVISVVLVVMMNPEKSEEPTTTLDAPKPSIINALDSDENEREPFDNWPRTLDPAYISTTFEAAQVGMCYETLYTYDLFDTNKVVPLLADGMPKISDDGLTWTIKLKRPIYFHKSDLITREEKWGIQQLDAGDVRASILRLASSLDTPNWWKLQNRIEGLDSYRDGIAHQIEASKPGYDGPNAQFDYPRVFDLDEERIEIHLTHPQWDFINVLCDPALSIVPSEAFVNRDIDISWHPVGSGPYVLDEVVEGEFIRWTANPGYRDARYPSYPYIVTSPEPWPLEDVFNLADRSLPMTRTVTYRAIDDVPSAFASGQIDTLGSRQYPDDSNQRLQELGGHTIDYLTFNMEDELVGDPNGKLSAALRKAIREAIAITLNRPLAGSYGNDWDNETLADAFEAKGLIGAADVFEAASFRRGTTTTGTDNFSAEYGRDADHDPGKNIRKGSDGSDGKHPFFDLVDAGFKNIGSGVFRLGDPITGQQVEIEVLLRGVSELPEHYQLFWEKLGGELGIEFKLVPLPFADFLERLNTGEFQMAHAGWVLDVPDPVNFLGLFHSRNAVANGVNLARYKSEAMDTLLDGYATEMINHLRSPSDATSDQLEIIRHKLNDTILEDNPIIPLFVNRSYRVVASHVTPALANAFNPRLIKYWSSTNGQLNLSLR